MATSIRQRDFHAIFLERQFGRLRQKIRHHLYIAHGLIRVNDFLFHILPFLYANSLPQ